MKWILFSFLLVLSSLSAHLSPEKALKDLQEGNRRFANEKLWHPDRTEERRLAAAKEQYPFAVIVTCSDSRVAPEILFDQGLGDLFVVRVAGNVIGSIELESILYAVDHLDSVLVMVLGHQNCGAVHAAMEKQTEDIPAIAKLINPSIKKAEKEEASPSLKRTIKLNAITMKNSLLKSKNIAKKVRKKSLALYAAYYDFDTGLVTFLSDNN